MKMGYGLMMILGLAAMGLSLWARRQGSLRWKYRFINGAMVFLVGIYFIIV